MIPTAYAKSLAALAGVVAMVLQQIATNGVSHIDWGTIIPAIVALLGVFSLPNTPTVPVPPPAK